MIPFADSANLVAALMAVGVGLTIGWTDRGDRRNHPLAACLLLIGLALIIDPVSDQPHPIWTILQNTIGAFAIISGAEWGRRIGGTEGGKTRFAANALFRAAQILGLVYWGLSVGYVLIAPEMASSDVAGFTRLRGLEFAIFAPIIGTLMLLGAIAIALLHTVKMDSAEAMRLRVLWHATPFLIAGLMLNPRYVPFTLTIGLLLLVFGSVKYLIIQGRRGQFMSQFLSPEVSSLVRSKGMEQVLKQERRTLSILFCDLRGFTNYARENDSEIVIELLERFYETVGQAAAKYDGTVKDHAGDGVLILVGAPIPVDDHEKQVVHLANDLMNSGQIMLAEAELSPSVGLGIGIATGTCTIGAIRGAGRLEYVAVGNPVNLAARLCDRAADGEILSDRRTAETLQTEKHIDIHDREPEPLKGFPEPIPVCAIQIQS